MAFELWLTFVVSAAVLTLIPGPSVLMVVGQALAHGRAAAFKCIAGDLAGGIIVIALSLLGVGALLATSAVLFQALKWAGVAYLVFSALSKFAQRANRFRRRARATQDFGRGSGRAC